MNVSCFPGTFCAIFILIASISAKGQEKETGLELIVSVQPLFAFNNALRLDLEIKKTRRLFNFVISPEIYGGNVNDKFLYKSYQADNLKGAGIGLSHKINITNKVTRPYLTYGFIYRNLQIGYEDEGFIPYQKDGLEFYEYGAFSDKIKINSGLLNVCFGLQTYSFDRFIIDFYMGGGYKLSSKRSAYTNNRAYDQEQRSFAYNGLVFLAGIKGGIRLNSKH